MADSGGASFTVFGVPGVVAGPARAEQVQSPYTVAIPTDGDLSSAVGEFLAGYLAGAGEIARHLAPGTELSPVSPPRT
ncbi:hypothetical protein ABT147_45560 [Streptomyces sp. NPDC001868]|uniref:hypothetical protein n=1 Tax=Streptomyces sp. NPDC001868 TaxID=3154401 RepID=UPI00332CE5BE